MSCIFATILGVAILWPAPTPVLEPLPSPNGYDEFVRAAQLSVWANGHFLEGNELRTHLEKNQEPLRLIRKALSHQWRQPSIQDPSHPGPLLGMEYFNKVTGLLSDERRFAIEAGRTDHALLITTDLLRIAHLFPIGGFLSDKNWSLLLEEQCLSDFGELEPATSGTSIQKLISTLIQMETAAEPHEMAVTRNRAFLENAWTFTERVAEMWKNRTLFPSHDFMSSESDLVDAMHRTARLRRQLMIRLATHIYQLEKGTPPRQISDLVPNILPMIPVDPETGTNLVLNPSK